MPLNNYMHPRNIYKIPPNFKQLAIDYPEFRKYVKQDISGKVTLDFKDNEALRALTVTLLKKDFGLNIEIPLNRLIPTVPLRLNYVLWIEDLLSLFEIEKVSGIDIGTGASSIYALLTAKLHNWSVIATDIDDENLNFAQKNVANNNLQHLITVKKVDGSTLLVGVIDKEYDFCMCNPPFFSKMNELDSKNKSRTCRRPPPRNAFTAHLTEVTTHGGELDFITKLINESVELKTKVRVYSTMVGQKSNIPMLKTLLRKAEVTSFVQTEFCQGHTTRWGLAWTFHEIDLRNVTHIRCTTKKSKPIKYVVPQLQTLDSLEKVVQKVKELLVNLQMKFEEVKRTQHICGIHTTAMENTWSHQRRKRREQLRQPCDQYNSVASNQDELHVPMEVVEYESHSPNKRGREDEEEEEADNSSLKRSKLDTEPNSVFLEFVLVIQKVDQDLILEMSWVDGTAPKDTLHQVMQYFKNCLK